MLRLVLIVPDEQNLVDIILFLLCCTFLVPSLKNTVHSFQRDIVMYLEFIASVFLVGQVITSFSSLLNYH